MTGGMTLGTTVVWPLAAVAGTEVRVAKGRRRWNRQSAYGERQGQHLPTHGNLLNTLSAPAGLPDRPYSEPPLLADRSTIPQCRFKCQARNGAADWGRPSASAANPGAWEQLLALLRQGPVRFSLSGFADRAGPRSGRSSRTRNVASSSFKQQNASTTVASNWVPAPRRSSSRARAGRMAML